ncbi:MAG: 2-(1,2-epoxy-1,2-dihydrophenyl)acetyl-CoA isomerase [Haloarculaceae archaeon]|jgi:2-(1,2-epoxy-1,2-dihydrophenyl)acetyl-CoA isomerase
MRRPADLVGEMPDYETLTVDHSGGVARITLDNLDQRNALDLDSADDLIDAVATLGEDPEARCIVLTHEGQFFGTGADLTKFSGDDPEGDAAYMRQLAGRLHEAIIQLNQTGTPVVGGLDGVAAGAGFSLALSPDLLVVSEEARLEYAYPRIGLPGDGGSTFFLPRLVGLRTAKEIALLDEPITPERAVEMGLATEVVAADAFEERIDEVATDLASGATFGLGAVTRLMTESFDRSLESQLAAETDAMAAASATDDFGRGLDAFFGDSEPEFTGE